MLSDTFLLFEHIFSWTSDIWFVFAFFVFLGIRREGFALRSWQTLGQAALGSTDTQSRAGGKLRIETLCMNTDNRKTYRTFIFAFVPKTNIAIKATALSVYAFILWRHTIDLFRNISYLNYDGLTHRAFPKDFICCLSCCSALCFKPFVDCQFNWKWTCT